MVEEVDGGLGLESWQDGWCLSFVRQAKTPPYPGRQGGVLSGK